MELKVSPRGNGACPFCKKREKCIILKRFEESVKTVRDPDKNGIEIVVYSCPLFEEKF